MSRTYIQHQLNVFGLKETIIHSIELVSNFMICQRNKIQVKFDVDFPLEVLGDQKKFQQMFLNCLLKVLGILKGVQIEIECKLAEIDMNNKFVVHIQIKVPNIKHKE